MKNPKWFEAHPAPEITDPSIAVLTYRQVKEMFGWTENTAIRTAVKRGELKRVRVNASKTGWRITAESALKRRQEMLELGETIETFGYTPEQLRQFKMAKKQREEQAVQALTADELRAAEQHDEALRLMNEHNERAARENFPPNHDLDYWLRKVGYVPPVVHGTPDERNAAFIAEENAKAPIWIGNAAFHGVVNGRTAEARATAYLAELEEKRKPKMGFSQQSGV